MTAKKKEYDFVCDSCKYFIAINQITAKDKDGNTIGVHGPYCSRLAWYYSIIPGSTEYNKAVSCEVYEELRPADEVQNVIGKLAEDQLAIKKDIETFHDFANEMRVVDSSLEVKEEKPSIVYNIQGDFHETNN